MILKILGLKKEFIGAQIECRVLKIIIHKNKKINIPEFLGLIIIKKIDTVENITYCEKEQNQNLEWSDIIKGVEKSHKRNLPNEVIFQPSISDSLKKFTKDEMIHLHRLLGKFSNF